MNRIVVYAAAMAALAEVDVIARVCNQQTVEVLRHHLMTIAADAVRATEPSGAES